MKTKLTEDKNLIDAILTKIKEQGVEYLLNIENRSTNGYYNSKNESNKLDFDGLGTLDTINLFNTRFESVIASSSGPRYWGLVTGGTTPAAIAGDWLASVYDQNAINTFGQGDISGVIEQETMLLLLDLLGLPENFFGGLVTGATMSNFTCMAVARQWIGHQYGKNFAKEGVSAPIKILAGKPHSSILKSLSMLGIGSSNYSVVPLLSTDREAIDIKGLKKMLEEFKGQPFILVTSAGTVNTGDFDNFELIKQMKENYNFWWHIDAAFGAFAACSNSHKYLLNGWEAADSITVDCHKWLNVPYENGAFFIRNEHMSFQRETFNNSNAPYLGGMNENINYLNVLPENSRRLKALPIWFTLNAYGKKGYREIVENNIFLATYFAKMIKESQYFELLAPVKINVVCFTLKEDEKNSDFLYQLNNTGKVNMTHTVFNSQKGIRAAFVNWRTSVDDVLSVIKIMENLAEKLN